MPSLLHLLLGGLLLGGLLPCALLPPRRLEPLPSAARDPEAAATLLDRFRDHDVVLLGETPHRGRRIHAFLARVLEEPAFPSLVDDLVVECGSARYQDVMDRWLLELEDVPRDELAHAWRDTTQLLVWDSPLYEELLARVRRLNTRLSRGERVRVLLGDPPIEWESVQRPGDLDRWFDREASFRSVIETEVLDRGRKALVLIGSSHLFERNPSRGFAADATDRDWLGQLLADAHPGRTTTVYPFFGREALASFEGAADWRAPVLVDLAAGPLGASSFGPIAPALSVQRRVDGAVSWVPLEPGDWPPMRVMVDALLYLGEASADEEVPPPPGTYRDAGYATELLRRARLLDAYFGFDHYVPEVEALPPPEGG